MAPNPTSPGHQLKRLVAILVCTLTLSSAWRAGAANYTYNANTTTTTQWSAGTSWSATPVSASDTTLDFSATQATGINTISNNDLGGNFTLNIRWQCSSKTLRGASCLADFKRSEVLEIEEN
jgi:hypothetical protein